MKHNCYVVYSLTRDTRLNQIVDITFLNCFETEAQARASLRYEADVDRLENDGMPEWLDEDTLKLSPGANPDHETTIHIDPSVPFHDRNEPMFSYSHSETRAVQEVSSKNTASLAHLITAAEQGVDSQHSKLPVTSKPYTLNAFLSAFGFRYDVYLNNSPYEANIRSHLIEDGKLNSSVFDKPLVGLVDLQGAGLGEIESDRFVIDHTLVSKIMDRMSIYIDDGVISEFEDAVEKHGLSSENRSLQELYELCEKLGVTEVSYSLAYCVMHPEEILVHDLDLNNGTIIEERFVHDTDHER